MLTNVQFLRFFAAMLVVFYHMAAHLHASQQAPGLIFGWAETAGFAGVDIFFVISGFIMAWTTSGVSGGAEAMAFARRRLARIYSGYWPFFLLAFGLFTWLGGYYLANAQLLRSFFLWPTELAHLLIPVSWTLIFELFFYLLFSVLIGLSGQLSREKVIRYIALFVLFWTLYSHFIRRAYDPGLLEEMNVYEQYLLFPYLLEFLAGAMLAGWLNKNREGRGWAYLLMGLLLFIAGGWINQELFGGKLIEGYHIIWRVLIFGSASVFILTGLVRLENKGWAMLPRFSRLAGGASYALYLCHTLILAGTYQLGLNAWLRGQSGWVAQAAFLSLALLMLGYSMVHFRWVERPLHQLFRKLSSV